MGSTIKSLIIALTLCSFSMSCEGDPEHVEGNREAGLQYELQLKDSPPDISDQPSEKSDKSTSGEQINKGSPQVSQGEYKWWMEMPWEKTVRPLVFDKDGTPITIEVHPRSYYKITKSTKSVTIEAHRQIAKAVGLRVSEDETPDLSKFLTARSSVETSMQGNQRPFDTRGSVHSLDIRAAYRSGIRSRDKYVEAGNRMAEHEPYVFLGYGQAGMISWLYLDDWDILGDPRMLGDNVIAGLTYRRVMEKSYKRLKNSRIKCYEYSDEGRVVKKSYNGRSYIVASYAVDEEKASSCIEKGAESKKGRSNPEALESRCRRENRKTYKWKIGEPQPDNTVPVKNVTWWDLKRASGGKPCPAWKGDEQEKAVRASLEKRALSLGLDISKTVRLRDLGEEPEGVNQYDLWMGIWDATMSALVLDPINWENLRSIRTETQMEFKPSKEKIEQERRRARGEDINPLAKNNKATARTP